MPGIVIDVSATFVATMILRSANRANTLFCSAAVNLAYNGKIRTPNGRSPAMSSQVSRISCSVGMNTRMSPLRRCFKSRIAAFVARSTWVSSPFSAGSASGWWYWTSTGYRRPETSMTEASLNAFENFSVSMVADVMINFRSSLLFSKVRKIPRIKSMFRLRSWASSTIIVS